MVSKCSRLLVEQLYWPTVKTIVVYHHKQVHASQRNVTIVLQDMFFDSNCDRSKAALIYLIERAAFATQLITSSYPRGLSDSDDFNFAETIFTAELSSNVEFCPFLKDIRSNHKL